MTKARAGRMAAVLVLALALRLALLPFTSGGSPMGDAGNYIVIASTEHAGSPELKKTMATVKQHYADAYVKKTRVYVGCMH